MVKIHRSPRAVVVGIGVIATVAIVVLLMLRSQSNLEDSEGEFRKLVRDKITEDGTTRHDGRDEQLVQIFHLLVEQQCHDVFVDLLHDPVTERRHIGLQGIARIGDTKAKEMLASCLDDKNPNFRAEAAVLLARIDTDGEYRGRLQSVTTDDAYANVRLHMAFQKVQHASASTVGSLVQRALQEPIQVPPQWPEHYGHLDHSQ